jgi:hypothetical protein
MPKVVVESGIPNSVFYNMTGIGTAIVMGLGVYYFLKFKPKWDKQFGQNQNNGEVPCFADTFVQGGSSVLRMKFSAKTPRHRKPPKTLAVTLCRKPTT